MKYIKPELKIEKFSIVEDIADISDPLSTIIPPWFKDEANDGNGDLIIESLSEAWHNVFDI